MREKAEAADKLASDLNSTKEELSKRGREVQVQFSGAKVLVIFADKVINSKIVIKHAFLLP